jgi:hypothetical protein
MMEIRVGKDGEPLVEESNVTQQQTLLDGLLDE